MSKPPQIYVAITMYNCGSRQIVRLVSRAYEELGGKSLQQIPASGS